MRFFYQLTIVFALFITLSATAADNPAPVWQHQDSNGTEVEFPNQEQDVAIVLFWATWCPYCKQLMPHLQSIVDEYGRTHKVRVYALSINEDGDPAAYLKEKGFSFRLFTEADAIAKQYGVKGTPNLVLVDRSGNIRYNLNQAFKKQKELNQSLSHWEKAGRRAPFWATEIRLAMDELLQNK